MNKKYIALLFSLMAATPSATFAKSVETTQTQTSKKRHVKEISVVIGAVVVIAVIGGCAYFGMNRKKNNGEKTFSQQLFNQYDDDEYTDDNNSNFQSEMQFNNKPLYKQQRDEYDND